MGSTGEEANGKLSYLISETLWGYLSLCKDG